MSADDQEQELYEAFNKARVAMWEAHRLYDDYLKKKLKMEYNDAVTIASAENKSPTCIECGKPYFSIPRLGIFHICSKD
jgi:hypothetical protein